MSKDFRGDVPQNPTFVKELFVLLRGIADFPNDDPVGLEFTLVGEKKAIAIGELCKTDFLGFDIDLRVRDLRYNLTSLIDGVFFSQGHRACFRRSHTLVLTSMDGAI
jgi:hypothetical protein